MSNKSKFDRNLLSKIYSSKSQLPIAMFKRNLSKIQLPNEFASDLLDCEIQVKLSNRPSKETMKRLIQLYTQGVEYYESIRSYKYLYFQKKMSELFMSQAMNNIFDEEKEQAQSPIHQKKNGESQEDMIQAIKIRQKREKMVSQFTERTKDQNTDSEIQSIMENIEHKAVKVKGRIQDELENQDRDFQKKLMRRKSRVMTVRSLSYCEGFGENETSESLLNQEKQKQIELDSTKINKLVNKIPLKVNFTSVINEDQSGDEDEAHSVDVDQRKNRERKLSGNVRKNKMKSESDLFSGLQNELQM